MVFSSTIFLFLFLPIVIGGYYLLGRRFRNIFLLVVSLFFYAWGEPEFFLVMIGSVLVNYLAALVIYKYKKRRQLRRAKLILSINVLFNLSLFFVFKYLNFAVTNINLLFNLLGFEGNAVQQTNILLPIGISFFTFQAMSYVFDVYYDKGEVQKNPLNVALFVSLFPQLIAGPIVRYQTVADEIKARIETSSDFVRGIQRFVVGLAKKVIIANTVAVAVDAAFAALSDGTLTVGYSWMGAVAYALQIYFDFSGYSDMAIGLGLMFGFHFLENFNHPYQSKTVSEFWHRWHISLGTWFRDYIYFPLGGSRVNSKGRLIFNLFVVWALTGIWHGSNWTFILWGLFYFVLLTFEKLTDIENFLKSRKVYLLVYRIFTLLCVILGWVIFRANNLAEGFNYIAAMFGSSPNGIWSSLTGNIMSQYLVVVIIAIVCCFDWKRILSPWVKKLSFRLPKIAFLLRLMVISALAFISFSFTVASTYNPFIYFNF